MKKVLIILFSVVNTLNILGNKNQDTLLSFSFDYARHLHLLSDSSFIFHKDTTLTWSIDPSFDLVGTWGVKNDTITLNYGDIKRFCNWCLSYDSSIIISKTNMKIPFMHLALKRDYSFNLKTKKQFLTEKQNIYAFICKNALAVFSPPESGPFNCGYPPPALKITLLSNHTFLACVTTFNGDILSEFFSGFWRNKEKKIVLNYNKTNTEESYDISRIGLKKTISKSSY